MRLFRLIAKLKVGSLGADVPVSGYCRLIGLPKYQSLGTVNSPCNATLCTQSEKEALLRSCAAHTPCLVAKLAPARKAFLMASDALQLGAGQTKLKDLEERCARRSKATDRWTGRRSQNWPSLLKTGLRCQQIELSEYCRSKGFYPQQVSAWKAGHASTVPATAQGAKPSGS